MIRHTVPVLALLLLLPLAGRALAQQAAAEPKWYDRIRFEGDFRPRFDLTHQDLGEGMENEDLRNRLRFRFRLGASAAINQQFAVGFRVASNEGKNPTSGNVTFGSGTAPKTIVIDRVWATWTPNATLSVTAGKFANPIEKPVAGFRSELVWDEDLAPEGLTQTITLRRASRGMVRRVAVHLEQWYLQEYSRANDSWMLGGQALVDLKPAERATLNLAGGYYGYANVGPLAQVANGNSLVNISNSVVLEDGTTLEGGKLLRPDPANPFDRFASGFGQLHGSASLRLDRFAGEAGLQLYGEVVRNLEADDHGTGYQFGVGLDRIRKLPGWSVAAVWVHIEQEAVLSMFSYSDLGRGGTNLKGLIAAVQYRPVQGVTLALREHIVSPIRTVQPDTPINRLQVDVSFAF
jgi:hypothetical protein